MKAMLKQAQQYVPGATVRGAPASMSNQ